MPTVFSNAVFLTPHGLAEGLSLAVGDDGKIVSLGKQVDAGGAERVDLGGKRVVPGFIDLQINGGGGLLFNDAPTVEAIATIGEAHRRFGTTGFLATLISDELDVIRAGIAAVEAAITAGVPGILGIHIEGPFLNAERKGIHDTEKLRPLDTEGIDLISSLRVGKTLVTLAPECVRPEQIAELSRRGVVVAAGHSEATFAQMQTAFAHGLSAVTHLFNAMSQLQPRAPGVVGAALDNPDCWCGVIVDGIHVDPATLRLAIRAKGGTERFVLVSDAMPIVGSSRNEFEINGQHVTLVDGVCRSDDGTLAGSDLDMARAVLNAQTMLGLDLPTACQMASINPARMMGCESERGLLVPGLRADFVVLNDDGSVSETFLNGLRT